MPLFEVVILEKPTKKELERGSLETLVYGPATIVATDIKTAGIQVIFEAKDELELQQVDKSRLEVIVRPFSKG